MIAAYGSETSSGTIEAILAHKDGDFHIMSAAVRKALFQDKNDLETKIVSGMIVDAFYCLRYLRAFAKGM